MTCKATWTFSAFTFEGYGSHSDSYEVPYINAAAALMLTEEEVHTFIEKLDKTMRAASDKVDHDGDK